MELLLKIGFPLLTLFLIGMSLWLIGYHLFQIIWMFFPFKIWRMTDVTDLNIPLPSEVAENQFEVEMLGFQPAGVFEIQFTPLMKKGHYTRYYTADNYELYAEVTQMPELNLIGFFTLFPDNAVIMTSYPLGENIQTPMFHQRYAANSIDAAYYHHLKQVERWRGTHGKPVLLHNSDEIKAASSVYRQLHRRRHFRRLLALHAMTALASASLVVLWVAIFTPFIPVSLFIGPIPIPFSLMMIPVSFGLHYAFNASAKRFERLPEAVDDAQKAEDGFNRDL